VIDLAFISQGLILTIDSAISVEGFSGPEPEPDFAGVRLDDNRYRDRHPDPEDVIFLVEVSDQR
jgi:hypothetical protein